MRAIFGLFIGLLPMTLLAPAQAEEKQVANYAVGRYGMKSHEQLSFWVEGGRPGTIEYSSAKEDKSRIFAYGDSSPYLGKPSFRIQSKDGRELRVVPRGTTLEVIGEKGEYRRIFKWEYEGPIDGRGTFCTPCAPDEKAAMALINKYFLNP